MQKKLCRDSNPGGAASFRARTTQNDARRGHSRDKAFGGRPCGEAKIPSPASARSKNALRRMARLGRDETAPPADAICRTPFCGALGRPKNRCKASPAVHLDAKPAE